METRILHFGQNGLGYLSLLTKAGFTIDECGRSVQLLRTALAEDHCDAVGVSDDGDPVPGLPGSVRSFSKVPLILFENEARNYDPADFDLVVSNPLPAEPWLYQVRKLIERSRALRTASALTQQQSAALRLESETLREESAAHRIASRAEQRQFSQLTEPDAPLASHPAIAKVRILIVDDHAIWRKSLHQMLDSHARFEVVGEAGDGPEAIRKTIALKPELIILDIGLPSVSGIDVARQIRQMLPNTSILLLSTHESGMVRDAVGTIAESCLSKTDAATQLFATIDEVLLQRRIP